jgi:hypothetical protein
VGLVVVLLWENLAAASDREGAEITVLLNNSAGVSRLIVNEAEAEAGRIFRDAGIEIVWVDCSRGVAVADACRGVPGGNEFFLQIASKGSTSSDRVFGVAFLAEDGNGKYSNVFYDRVERAHGDFGAPVSRLLGAVAAHELGHLLLGSHAHSHLGLMTAVWSDEVLRDMEMGSLLFNRDQAIRMRAQIRGSERTLVSRGAGARRQIKQPPALGRDFYQRESSASWNLLANALCWR